MRNEHLRKSIEHLVGKFCPISGRTRLVKLLYLADRDYRKRHGCNYTEASYYRYNHGPFAKEILAAVSDMSGLEIEEVVIPLPDGGTTYEYHAGRFSRLRGVDLDPEFQQILNQVAERWARESLRKLLKHVYAAPDFERAHFGDALLA